MIKYYSVHDNLVVHITQIDPLRGFPAPVNAFRDRARGRAPELERPLFDLIGDFRKMLPSWFRCCSKVCCRSVKFLE
jgi:hypothetical protein